MASGDDEIRMTLRIPELLRDQLRDAGEASKRSVNAEIVHRLEASFSEPSNSVVEILERPEGVTDEQIAAAVETASRRAVHDAFQRLGFKPLPIPTRRNK